MAVSHDTATRLSHDLIRLFKLFSHLRHNAPRPHPGMDPSAYPILFSLLEEPRRVSALAEVVHSDISTVSRQVSSLVGHELVEKVPDPLDGRASLLSLTEQGRWLLQQLQVQRGQWFRTVLSDWTEQEAQTFIAQLERLAAGLAASPPMTPHKEQ